MTSFLQINHLHKHYQQANKPVIALHDVSLELFEAQVLALLGPNGAGKTTLSTLLATLIPPSSGHILWRGKSIYQHLDPYRKQVGYCPQRPNLFSNLTLRDNLLFAARFYGLSDKISQERLKELSNQLHLDDYLDSKSMTLSGGWRQRFMIARALMHSPKILILDEPTVGLDPHIRRQIWEIIKSLKSDGVSILLTTHYLDEAEQLADRVCMMDKGQIKLIETPTKLKDSFHLPNLESIYLQLIQEETGA